MLSRLRHPNIVALLAVDTSGKHLYVCTEFVNGCDLESIIFEDCTFQALQLNDKNSISLQLLQAVSYMHGQGVIHQDIKSRNILVNAQSLVTKICDLGFGKLIGANGTLANRAISGNTIANPGTHLYMAPECLLNIQKAGVASDMWSVGTTLSELYTGFTYWNFSEAHFNDNFQCRRLSQGQSGERKD